MANTAMYNSDNKNLNWLKVSIFLATKKKRPCNACVGPKKKYIRSP